MHKPHYHWQCKLIHRVCDDLPSYEELLYNHNMARSLPYLDRRSSRSPLVYVMVLTPCKITLLYYIQSLLVWKNVQFIFIINERQCTYKGTLRRDPKPLLQWKSNKYYIFWVCVCRLWYPACNKHAPYCPLWPARLYNNFLQFLINGTTFDRKLLNINCEFLVSLRLWNISPSKNWERYLTILTKLELSPQIFKK